MLNPNLLAFLPLGWIVEPFRFGDEDATVGLQGGHHLDATPADVCNRHGGILQWLEVYIPYSCKLILEEVPRV
jgi:hypothetical protein